MANFPDKEDFFGSLNVAAEVAADFDVTFNDTFSVVDTQAEVDESAIGVLAKLSTEVDGGMKRKLSDVGLSTKNRN